jgi:transposase-like protein
MAASPLSKEERARTMAAYERCKGNVSKTARLLGIPRSTLQNRLREANRRDELAEMAPEGASTVDERMELLERIRTLEAAMVSQKREALNENFIKKQIIGLRSDYDVLGRSKWLAPKARRRGDVTQSTPTLLLSDLHWGEVVDQKQMSGVNEYNIEIANRRLKAVINKSISLLRNHITGIEYPGFVLCLAGDMLAGDIHEELRETNDGATFSALLNLLSALIATISLLADEFNHVYVPCVAGNHGRTTRKPRAKQRNVTNLDWLMYQFLALHFQDDKRVFIDSPDSPELTYKVFNHTYHLCHGDQLGKGGDGIIGSFGPIIRGDHKRRSLQSQLNNPYNTLIHGHYHNYAATQRFISNGSLVGYDEYALANGFGFEIPQQAFWLTHADHGITFSMPVHADEPKKIEERGDWVTFRSSSK